MGLDSIADFDKLARRQTPDALRRSPPTVDKRQQALPISLKCPALPVPGLNIPGSIDVPFVATVGTKIIPDAAHPFQVPPANAQRGGCPGLNIMANYGEYFAGL